jgi:hypothetical protein
MLSFVKMKVIIAISLIALSSGQLDLFASETPGDMEQVDQERAPKRARITVVVQAPERKPLLIKLRIPPAAQREQQGLVTVQPDQMEQQGLGTVRKPQGQDLSHLAIIRQPFFYWLAFSSEDDSVLIALAKCSRRDFDSARGALAMRRNEGAVLHFLYHNLSSLCNSSLPVVRDLAFGRSPLTAKSLFEPVIRGKVLMSRLISGLDTPNQDGYLRNLFPLFLRLNLNESRHLCEKPEDAALWNEFKGIALRTNSVTKTILYAHYVFQNCEARPEYIPTLEEAVNSFADDSQTLHLTIRHRQNALMSSLVNSLVATRYFADGYVQDPLRTLLRSICVIEEQVKSGQISDEQYMNNFLAFKWLSGVFLSSPSVTSAMSDKVFRRILLSDDVLCRSQQFHERMMAYDMRYLDTDIVSQSLTLIIADNFPAEDVPKKDKISWALGFAKRLGFYTNAWLEEVYGQLVRRAKTKERMKTTGSYVKALEAFRDTYLKPNKITGPADIKLHPYTDLALMEAGYQASRKFFEHLLHLDNTDLRKVCKNGFLYAFLKSALETERMNAPVLKQILKEIKKQKLNRFLSKGKTPLCFFAQELQTFYILEEFEGETIYQAQDTDGNTLIHKVLEVYGQWDRNVNTRVWPKDAFTLVRHLLDKNCDPRVANNRGEKPRDLVFRTFNSKSDQHCILYGLLAAKEDRLNIEGTRFHCIPSDDEQDEMDEGDDMDLEGSDY